MSLPFVFLARPRVRIPSEEFLLALALSSSARGSRSDRKNLSKSCARACAHVLCDKARIRFPCGAREFGRVNRGLIDG